MANYYISPTFKIIRKDDQNSLVLREDNETYRLINMDLFMGLWRHVEASITQEGMAAINQIAHQILSRADLLQALEALNVSKETLDIIRYKT